MAEKKLNILADFPAISTEEWMAKINTDLKGADFAKKLVWKSPEGFDVYPFYRLENIEGWQTLNSAPGKFPYIRGTKEDNDWFVRQEIVDKVVLELPAPSAGVITDIKKGDGLLLLFYHFSILKTEICP